MQVKAGLGFTTNAEAQLEDWFNGTTTKSAIDSYIYDIFGDDFLGTLDADAVATLRFRNGSYDMLWALDKNNLAKWRSWAPKTSLVRLCHSSLDERVSHAHSYYLVDAIDATPVDGDIEYKFLNQDECSSHVDCAKACTIHIIGQMVKHEAKFQEEQPKYHLSLWIIVGAVVGAVLLGFGVASSFGKNACFMVTDDESYDLLE